MRYIFLLSVVFVFSCKPQKNPEHKAPHFDVEFHQLDMEAGVLDFTLFGDDLVCRLENGKIVILDSFRKRRQDLEELCIPPYPDYIWQTLNFKGKLVLITNSKKYIVFDSAYNRIESWESKLNAVKESYPMIYNDTFWIATSENEFYYLDNSIKLNSSNIDEFRERYLLPSTYKLYEDSLYIVYGCSVGEFGGNVFFQSKISGNIKLYPAYAPTSSFKMNGAYFVINNLGGGYTSIEKITDPGRLYAPQMTAEGVFGSKDAFCCNCDTQNSIYYSIEPKERNKKDSLIGVYTTMDAFATPAASTSAPFLYDGAFYSFQALDTFFRILRVDSDTVLEVQRIALKNKRYNALNNIWSSQTPYGFVIVQYGRGTRTYQSRENVAYEFNVTVINKNKIDIYLYQKMEKHQ